jgi:hypothetical protein
VPPPGRSTPVESTASIYVPFEEEETTQRATPTVIKTEGASAPEGASTPEGASAPPLRTPTPPSDGLRQHTHSTAGSRQTPRYTEAFLSKVNTFGYDERYQSNMAYLAEIHTDQNTGEVDISDPRVYAAKRKSDPDMPTFHEAMRGDQAEQYVEAMKIEVTSLLLQKTWKPIPREEATNFIKSTWVFKLKRLPDGTPLKSKARFCVRGALQKEGVDYFKTYAPVIQWSTVRMLLTLVLGEGWATR